MPHRGHRQAYDFSALRVLIVDDSDHMLVIVRRLLSAMRIRDVTLAADAAEAFQMMKSATPDLIIVDWNMIPLDGIEFIRLVRRHDNKEIADAPILLLTAHTEPHRVHAARDAGVNHVSAKPASFKSLYRALVAIIEDERPFVRNEAYIGPDRRWKKGVPVAKERRKKGPGEPKPPHTKTMAEEV
jgi:CheY-like chemotaxis protein